MADLVSITDLPEAPAFRSQSIRERRLVRVIQPVSGATIEAAAAIAADVAAATVGGKADKGANSDINSLSGLTTPLSIGQGGTGASSQAGARSALGVDQVTNTSDAGKVASGPISDALALKADKAALGTAAGKNIDVPGGVAGFDLTNQALANVATRYVNVDTVRASSILPSVMTLELGGHTVSGLGAARYSRLVSGGAGPGRIQSGNGVWWALAEPEISLEMLGAGFGSPDADAAALRAANALTATARLDSDIDLTYLDPPFEITDSFNVRLYGKGSVKGVPLSLVVPDLAPACNLPIADSFSPSIHLIKFHGVSTPRVGIAGDSLTTLEANSVGRANMLSPVLKNKYCQTAALTGRSCTVIQRGLGGRGWFNMDPANPLGVLDGGRDPDWLTPSQPIWPDYIKADRPDALALSLGMNPSPRGELTPFRNAMNYFASWNYVPDILVILPTFPRPTTGFGGGFKNASEALRRIANAAILRSVIVSGLLPLRVGMIDVARAQFRAQLGFDPIIGAMWVGDRPDHAPGVPGTYVGTRDVYDGFSVKVRVDQTQLIAGSGDGISIPTGIGSDDVLQIVKASTGPNDYIGTAYAGMGLGDPPWQYANFTFTRPPGADNYTWFKIEKHNHRLTVHQDSYEYPSDGGTYSKKELVSIPCISHGGPFRPAVQRLTSKASVIFAEFEYMDPAPCQPAGTADLFWNNDAKFGQVGPWGGSGYNHYSNWLSAHVIEPLLAQTPFFSGSAARAQAVNNMALLSAYLYN